jgi:RNA recognition motif-containing protein
MRARPLRGNIFVGNLPPDFSDEQLAEAFDSFGIVLSASVARDPTNGKRLRYGFVDIATERAAERAIAAMNGVAIDGHKLDVRISEKARKAQPKKPAPPRPSASAQEASEHEPSGGPPGHDFVAPTPRRRTPAFVVERRPLPRRF